jgi:murein DD-endopeptidase MepM/ murein hydrolase activator NlpD
MRKVEGICLRGTVLVALAAGLAACSGDTHRFAENPFGSKNSAQETTGSVSQTQAAPVSKVEAKPLHSAAPASQPAVISSRQGVAGGGAGMYQPSTHHDVTGTVKQAAKPQPAPQPQWTWDGGTPVTVAQGETIESLSLRYNVPETALMQANGLQKSSKLTPGQRIVIPRRTSGAPAVAAPATKPAPAQPTTITHVVAPGETLLGISRHYKKSVREVATVNQLKYDHPLKIGDKLIIPGVAPAQAATAPASQAPRAIASAPSQSTARVLTPSVEPTDIATANGAAPQFRWPVRGRVISGFGPMTNGQQNDGINLAVPEGTAVRSAEDGVVAYSGNELKGYGNLVLVRHSNGFVTAYAHASELMVKKGDNVRRGQVIARSGATGTVPAPQLHFEIRKGSVPVDPMQFLKGA